MPLDALEHTLMQLESGIGALHIFAEEIQDAGNADLNWLAYVLQRDLDDAKEWHSAAHKAQSEAKGTGPAAVTWTAKSESAIIFMTLQRK